MEKLKVIVVDDEAHARKILTKLLIDTGKVDVLAQVSDSLKVEILCVWWRLLYKAP